MNKKAQMTFDSSQFSNSSPTQFSSPPNLFQRIAQGIAAIVFLLLFTPVIFGISEALLPNVCTNATTCLFFRFIVPGFILGGITGAIKYMWDKQQ
jgi:hypothetical protein